MRNGVWFYILFDHPDVIVRANKQNIGWVSNFFMKDHLIKFLKDNNITVEYGNTQYIVFWITKLFKSMEIQQKTIMIG